MSNNLDIDIDSVIERLLSVRNSRPGKQVQLEEREIRSLCMKSREIFITQPVLLELEAPIKICGTILSIQLYFFVSVPKPASFWMLFESRYTHLIYFALLGAAFRSFRLSVH